MLRFVDDGNVLHVDSICVVALKVDQCLLPNLRREEDIGGVVRLVGYCASYNTLCWRSLKRQSTSTTKYLRTTKNAILWKDLDTTQQ